VDVRNTFNSVSWLVIFQKLRSLFDFLFWLSHLFDDSTHVHFHCIFLKLHDMEFHNHFVKVRYIIGGPIGRNVVYSGSFSRYLPYNNNTPHLCFPFLGGWYTYSRSHTRCGSCIFMIVRRVINIRFFSAAKEVCILISSRVGPLYMTSFWLFYSWFGISYFGCTGGIHIIC
jgi:hypothetical protein